jgi:hypothetical protein
VILVLIGAGGSSRTVILVMSLVTPVALTSVIILVNLFFGADKPHQFGSMAIGFVLIFVPTLSVA